MSKQYGMPINVGGLRIHILWPCRATGRGLLFNVIPQSVPTGYVGSIHCLTGTGCAQCGGTAYI
ncbi:MAG: hypothetical protein AB7P24_17625 [Nitrospira sp.]